MRYLVPLLVMLLTYSTILGQERRDGEVTFITSQHVYVKLSSMRHLSEGDTLYRKKGDKDVPALQIKNLSSISAVCIPLIKDAFKVSDKVFALFKTDMLSEAIKTPTGDSPPSRSEGPNADSTPPLSRADPVGKKRLTQNVSGRLSFSSYSNLNGDSAARSQRMRYTFSMDANNLGGSRLSVESYLSFAHSNTNWAEVKENIFNGLKIYNVSVTYDFNESTHVSLGRKINPKLSSVGAVDGLQIEKKFGGITGGAIAGSRPDYEDYRFNPDLLQYGVYLGYDLEGLNGNMQTTLAFIEQTNHSMTDRRFAYFQHTNMLIKDLFFFGSAEVDLYKKIDTHKETIFTLTNTYLSLRYRIIRPLSVGLSYSARNNVIYYEAYKDFLERLLDNETLQGWRFRINYRPAKYLFVNVHAGYRMRKEDPRPSKNLNGMLTYSRIPWIGGSVNAAATWIETSYLNGFVFSLGITRNLLADKLSGGIKYRYADYLYRNTEMALIQHVGEVNLSWMVYKKLSFSVFYEGTFEKEVPYHRIYLNISQRF